VKSIGSGAAVPELWANFESTEKRVKTFHGTAKIKNGGLVRRFYAQKPCVIPKYGRFCFEYGAIFIAFLRLYAPDTFF
jgi:hypothetical protein